MSVPAAASNLPMRLLRRKIHKRNLKLRQRNLKLLAAQGAGTGGRRRAASPRLSAGRAVTNFVLCPLSVPLLCLSPPCSALTERGGFSGTPGGGGGGGGGGARGGSSGRGGRGACGRSRTPQRGKEEKEEEEEKSGGQWRRWCVLLAMTARLPGLS